MNHADGPRPEAVRPPRHASDIPEVRGQATQKGTEDGPGEAPCRPASPSALFVAFTALALQGFGGVLPVAQRVLVEQHRWMTPAQFLETLSVSQVLPGPNVVNLSLIVGDRFFGWRGAAAALAGMLAAPLLIVLTLAALHARFAEWPAVAGALRGMGAVSAGLVLASGLKLMPPLRRSPLGLGAALAGVAATALVVGVWRIPLAWAVLGLGGAGMAWAWWQLARNAAPKGGQP